MVRRTPCRRRRHSLEKPGTSREPIGGTRMTSAFPLTPESSDAAELSDRQRREIEYHRDRAAAHTHFATGRVDLSAVTSAHYRWWNAYWVILRKAKHLGLAGK